MKALILKDLLNMRKYMKSLAAMALMFVVLGVASGTPSMVSGVGTVFCLMVSMLAFSYDETSRWDAYGLSLPVTRGQCVSAKYLLALALIVGGTALGALLSLAAMAATGTINWDELLSVLAGTAGAGFVVTGILFPCIYKFGVEKSRFVMIVLFLIPFGGLYAWQRLIGPIGPLSANGLRWLAIAVPLLLVLLCIGSYFLSLRIYTKKEL